MTDLRTCKIVSTLLPQMSTNVKKIMVDALMSAETYPEIIFVTVEMVL